MRKQGASNGSVFSERKSEQRRVVNNNYSQGAYNTINGGRIKRVGQSLNVRKRT
jgi:hypothetical protein